MELSVIILNYKVPGHLLLCVDSVSKAISNINAEIIVADNDSKDNSLSLIEEYFPSVKLIPISENLGFAKGNNIAIKQAKGKYICLLNPDTVVAEDTFLKSLAFAKKINNLGALGVQLIDGRGNFLPESKRNIPTPKIALEKLLGLDKGYYANLLQKDDVGEVDILVGAFMLMRKDRYHQVGGLDEAYFMYGEDIDLSYQFLKNGFKNFYLGSIKCIHFKGESTVKDHSFRNHFFGAMQLFYKKHFKTNLVLQKTVLMGLAIAKNLKLGVRLVEPEEKKPKSTWLVSEDESLIERLKQYHHIKKIAYSELEKLNLNEALVIFDSKKVDYQAIINTIATYSKKECKFRIIPRTENVVVGSDYSNIKGKVTFI